MKISKRKLASLIFKRLNKSIAKNSIYDAIGIINESIINRIVNNEAVSVDNFGTLSSYLFHQHKGMNVASGQQQIVKSFKTVKFRVHSTFEDLVEQRKDKFKGT